MKYTKSYVAIITPFDNKLNVDYKKLEELVEFQIKNGTSGIVVCGTTGETPTLTEEEYINVIKKVIEVNKNRIKIVAGAGSNSTEKAIYLTNLCKNLGVDAVLSVVPYYNKPTQRAIIEHFKEIAKIGIDVILYNVPSRTGVNLDVNSIVELSKITNIVGIKEASGSIEKVIEIANNTENFDILSGDDHLVIAGLNVGITGVISVTANILPKLVSDQFELKDEKLLELNKFIYEIHNNMFIEGNPVTIKAAMEILGITKNSIVRRPLLEATLDTKNKLKELFIRKNLI